MYLLANDEITVECSGAATFDYAANLENFGDWFPSVVNISSENELPHATVGKQYRETVAVPMQGTRTVLLRVVDVSRPRRIITEGDLPTLLPRMEIEFHELAPNTCAVRWRMYSRNESRLARRTVLPFARRLMRRRATAGLRTLKRLLECREST